MDKNQVTPCNINTKTTDLLDVEAILKDDKNYIVRYIRHTPTVSLVEVPARNADGGIIADADYIRKRTICDGIPYGCMIAFEHSGQLRIGWSKRIEDKKLVETRDLHTMFSNVLSYTKGVIESSDSYQVAFNVFCRQLASLLSCLPYKDIEITFSKKDGKTAAIIRALNDTIILYDTAGNGISSTASGAIPSDIAKNLRWFIKQMEQFYGKKAANVWPADQEVTVAVPHDIVA